MNRITFNREGEIRPAAVVLVGLISGGTLTEFAVGAILNVVPSP